MTRSVADQDLHRADAMQGRVLITGGAGFIGSHLADELLRRGYSVRVLDCLEPQVHGPERRRPAYLSRDVELIVGDVRDPTYVRTALKDIELVFHLAARVGVGQSMYQIADYTSVNGVGTAVLLEALVQNPVKRLVVASSMAIYGEGLYRDPDERSHMGVQRTARQLAHGDWDPTTPDGRPLTPVPTPESMAPSPTSIYALSKHDEERMCLMAGAAYQIPTVALRFFNVYGPRQVVANPYTGALAIFASRFLSQKRPLVFEDGKQLRDYVHVRDVAIACCLAAESEAASGEVLNIGSGHARTICEVAERMARVMGVDITPELSGQYRAGDVRHCTADIGLARRVLRYNPTIDLDDGLGELVDWLGSKGATERVDTMRAELASRGLAL